MKDSERKCCRREEKRLLSAGFSRPHAGRITADQPCSAEEKLTDDGFVVRWCVGGSARERNICQARGKNLQTATPSGAAKRPAAGVAEDERQAGMEEREEEEEEEGLL